MSGHSKWSKIKRQKQATDKKKGKIFSKLSKTISIAVREKGKDPADNSDLRLAIEKAREANMPSTNIEKAIKRGAGEIEGREIEQGIYEIYGPGGLAIIVKVLTDNNNRTVSEIKNIVSEHGGNLGQSGSVLYLFNQMGIIEIEPENSDKEKMFLEVAELGAEDIEESNEVIKIITKKENLQEIQKGLEKKYKITSAGIGMIPEVLVEIENEKEKNKLKKLLEALENQEDVEKIFTNLKK
ncbi:MAG: YebC/PmpR family DNA-binding transcriptional regulator [Patescibacteria group bacterium]|nr:YebC/PmpR family DNA-binding transcriptional regulator [Patescibacteria group bacterium]